MPEAIKFKPRFMLIGLESNEGAGATLIDTSVLLTQNSDMKAEMDERELNYDGR